MSKALVVLSGGADSAICAAIALTQYEEVHAITFNYGQRHSIELESAKAIAQYLNLTSHKIVDLRGVLGGESPLVSANPVEEYASPESVPDGVASTFVPGRNIVFLAIAASHTALIGASSIYTGICQTDYSGYPDCRESFASSMAIALQEGLGQVIEIKTPLMHLSKAESVELAQEIMGDRFTEIMSLTHTCYQGARGGCGRCAACLLRDRGFHEVGIDDPIWQFRQVTA